MLKSIKTNQETRETKTWNLVKTAPGVVAEVMGVAWQMASSC